MEMSKKITSSTYKKNLETIEEEKKTETWGGG